MEQFTGLLTDAFCAAISDACFLGDDTSCCADKDESASVYTHFGAHHNVNAGPCIGTSCHRVPTTDVHFIINLDKFFPVQGYK